MSVTFHPVFADSDAMGVRLSCACGTATADYLGASYEATLAVAAPVCGDAWCGADPAHRTVIFPFDGDVNLSNANAGHVLSVLGLYGEGALCGSHESVDFMGRVLTALALTPADAGGPATVSGQFVDCGRRPGYTQDVLGRLHEVAQWCIDNHRPIGWS